MKKHDFLIIGAGIFGIMAAIELRQRKHSVTIINPDQIPHPLAASTDISKIIRMEYGTDVEYMEMAIAAIEKWREWNDILEDTIFHEVGFLVAAKEQMDAGVTTFIEVVLNQELGEPFRRDAMSAPNRVAGINKADMRPQLTK